MRNRLFNSSSPLGLGIDLLSMDIIKGRDNGLSPYYVYVEMVFPDVFVKDFDDLEIVISKNVIISFHNFLFPILTILFYLEH